MSNSKDERDLRECESKKIPSSPANHEELTLTLTVLVTCTEKNELVELYESREKGENDKKIRTKLAHLIDRGCPLNMVHKPSTDLVSQTLSNSTAEVDLSGNEISDVEDLDEHSFEHESFNNLRGVKKESIEHSDNTDRENNTTESSPQSSQNDEGMCYSLDKDGSESCTSSSTGGYHNNLHESESHEESITSSDNDQEPPPYEEFEETVFQKYSILEEKYYDEKCTYSKNDKPVVAQYYYNKEIKREHFGSMCEVESYAASLVIPNDPCPVIFYEDTRISTERKVAKSRCAPDGNSHEKKPSNEKAQKQDAESRVGKEESPSLPGVFKTRTGENVEIKKFHLDPGADTGSIGYDYDIIKQFNLTVTEINGSPAPAILCKAGIAKFPPEEEVHVFDVDSDRRWNAIGLSQMKKYKFLLDFKEDIPVVVIAQHEDVSISKNENGPLIVTFKDNYVIHKADRFPYI